MIRLEAATTTVTIANIEAMMVNAGSVLMILEIMSPMPRPTKGGPKAAATAMVETILLSRGRGIAM